MPRNNKKAVEKRRADVAEAYLQGVRQYKIAERLGVSRSQITRDLQKLSELWRENAVSDISKKKAEDLAKLDVIEARAWEAYERSREPKTKKALEQKKGSARGTYKKQSQTEEEMVGDPRWMDIILKCMARREEILGYGAARKLDINGEMNHNNITFYIPSNGRDNLPDSGAVEPQD